jgi:hypothetical protein
MKFKTFDSIPLDLFFTLSRTSIAKDVINLLNSYIQLKTTSIEMFKECWDASGFILMHFVVIERGVTKTRFMEEIYCNILKFLKNGDLHTKHACLYSLYFIASTSPLSPELIPITPGIDII